MNIDNTTPVGDQIESTSEEIVEVIPADAGPKGRNHFKKVENPKNVSFTGRANATEAERIKDALEARKQPGTTYDIVRFCLDMMDHIESDFLQTFKTKKKK